MGFRASSTYSVECLLCYFRFSEFIAVSTNIRNERNEKIKRNERNERNEKNENKQTSERKEIFKKHEKYF